MACHQHLTVSRFARLLKPHVYERAFPPGLQPRGLAVYADLSAAILRQQRRQGVLMFSFVFLFRGGLLAKHRVAFAEQSRLSKVVSTSFVDQCTGHRLPVVALAVHPSLPFLLSVGSGNVAGEALVWPLPPCSVFLSERMDSASARCARLSLPAPALAAGWLPLPGLSAFAVCLSTAVHIFSSTGGATEPTFVESCVVAHPARAMAVVPGRDPACYIVLLQTASLKVIELTVADGTVSVARQCDLELPSSSGEATAVVPLCAALPGAAFPTNAPLFMVQHTGGGLSTWLIRTEPLSLAAVAAADIAAGTGWQPSSLPPVACLARVALAGLSGSDARVQVWENQSEGLQYRLEDSVACPAPARGLAWLGDGTGGALLAVAQPTTVLVHAQYTANAHGRWMLLHRVELVSASLSTVPLSMAGTAGGLVIGAGSELAVFGKWVAAADWRAAFTAEQQRHAVDEPSRSLSHTVSAGSLLSSEFSVGSVGSPSVVASATAASTSQAVSMPGYNSQALNSLMHDAAAVNRVLPQYHPRHILHLLMAGNLTRPRFILNHLLITLSNPVPPGPDGRYSVPALPWSRLQTLEASATSATKSRVKNDYSQLFGASSADDTDDSGPVAEPLAVRFDKAASARLLDVLSRLAVVGLTAVDQMHLLAIVEVYADVDGDPHRAALDECGVRFFVAARRFASLSRTLSVALRPKGLRSSEYVWAFFSDAHERLLELSLQGRPMDWADLQALGAGYWLRSADTVRACCEKVAKQRYAANQQPLEAALFYLALKKKSLLQGLFKLVRDDRMQAFFANDFTQERWQTASLKNAYALLSKRRFEQAAAFFLLAGSLRDAVQVCWSNLEDPQLAIFITRVYEGDGATLQQLLRNELLPHAQQTHDVYSTCMLYWLLREPANAVQALLASVVHTDAAPDHSDAPALLGLHHFLLRHPQVAGRSGTVAEPPAELVQRTAYVLTQCGLPDLALETLADVPARKSAAATVQAASTAAPKQAPSMRDMISSGTFSFDAFGFGDSDPVPAVTAAPKVDTSVSVAGSEVDQKATDMLLSLRRVELATPVLLRLLDGSSSSAIEDASLYIDTAGSFCELQANGLVRLATAAADLYDLPRAEIAGSLVVGDLARVTRRLQSMAGDVLLTVAAAGAVCCPKDFPYAPSTSGAQGQVRILLHALSDGLQQCCVARVRLDPTTLCLVVTTVFVALLEQCLAAADLKGVLRLLLQLQDNERMVKSYFGSSLFTLVDAANAIAAGRCSSVSPLLNYFSTDFDEKTFEEVDMSGDLNAEELGPSETNGKPDPDSLFAWTLLRQALAKQVLLVLTSCCQSAELAAAVPPCLAEVVAMLTARATALEAALAPLKVPRRLSTSQALGSHPAPQHLFKIRNLQELSANPFQALGPRRLWHWLVQRQALQAVFERAVYPPSASSVIAINEVMTWTDVYRAHTELVAMCINPLRPDNLALASSRSIYELIVADDDGNESGTPVPSGRASPLSPSPVAGSVGLGGWSGGIGSGWGRLHRSRASDDDAHLQRQQGGTRHLAAHPVHPMYLAGGSDGAVRMYHFDGQQPLELRSGGARITHIAFDTLGDKYGTADLSGDVCLWRYGSEMDSAPYFQARCHTRRSDCFTFLDSASRLVTGGLSTDGHSAGLWDVLLPPRQALVRSFACCEGGVRSVVYCASSSTVYLGGRMGHIAALDLRRMELVQWQAHESMVRSLQMAGNHLVSGGAEGSIKLWSTGGALVRAWPAVHARPSMLGRPAISALAVAGNVVYSCGAEGVVRQCQLE